MSVRDETDAQLAARLRAKRTGEPVLRPAVHWTQLYKLSTENIHEMIMRPYRLRESILVGIQVDSRAVTSGEFIITTSRITHDVHRIKVSRSMISPPPQPRTAKIRVLPTTFVEELVKQDATSQAWFVNDRKTAEWASVEFLEEPYLRMVRTPALRKTPAHMLESWLRMELTAGPTLLRQHTHPSWRLLEDRSEYHWYLASITVPTHSVINDESLALMNRHNVTWEAARDADDRATFTFRKKPRWVNHEGMLATPWGLVNCAIEDPVIKPKSQLANLLQGVDAGMRVSVPLAVWLAGLEMPPYDRHRVDAILDAQTVCVEVPLGA